MAALSVNKVSTKIVRITVPIMMQAITIIALRISTAGTSVVSGNPLPLSPARDNIYDDNRLQCQW